MLTFNLLDFKLGSSQHESDVYQFNSFAHWRARSKRPLRLTGAIRAVSSTTQNLSDKSEIQTASGSLGAFYEWSPRWLHSASLEIGRAHV